MNVAERGLLDLGWGASDSLWRTRREALGIYRGSPKLMSYVEEISPKMRSERLLVGSIEANGLLTIMAGLGRCDLVKHHVGNGPTSCDEYSEWSKPVTTSGSLERRFPFDPSHLTPKRKWKRRTMLPVSSPRMQGSKTRSSAMPIAKGRCSRSTRSPVSPGAPGRGIQG